MFCTCSYPDTQPPRRSLALTDPGNNIPKDFLDSVFVKKRLSFDQIKEHTNIDTIYDKENIRFVGDTVWYRKGKHPLAIVRYRDSLIDRKLLLVFNRRGKCTASLIVGMDGDVDSFDSVRLNYRISDNNNFSTTETWTYCGGIRDDKITTTKQFYWIDKKGHILAQNNIIHSFTRPKELTARRRQ